MECKRVHARLLLFLQSATRQQQQGQVSDSCDHHIHLHHYTMCYQLKKGKCSNRTHKILIIIVHINLVTLIENLMKIRNSITKKYFSKRKKSLLNTQQQAIVASSSFCRQPQRGQVKHNSESSSTPLPPSTISYITLQWSSK